MDEDKNPNENLDDANTEKYNFKKGFPLIALRPDQETYNKINYLTRVCKTSKSETIKRAVGMSYNGLLMKNTVDLLIPEIKTVFGEQTKLTTSRFGRRQIDEWGNEEAKVDFSYDGGYVIFELPQFEKKCENKKINSAMQLLILEMKIDSLNLMKITIFKPLIGGPFSDIPGELIKEIHGIGAKNNLDIKSATVSKKSDVQIEYHLEMEIVPHEKPWRTDIRKYLQSINKAMEVLCQNKFFINKKS